MPGFDAGDHITVKRLLYTHHGIYVNDGRVIDLSGGRNILEKPKALVQARTLKEFEGKRGRAEQKDCVVVQGDGTVGVVDTAAIYPRPCR